MTFAAGMERRSKGWFPSAGPRPGLNPLSCTWCWTRPSPALSSSSQSTGESPVLILACPVFIWVWGGDAAGRHSRSRITKLSFQKALQPCPLHHILVPSAALAAHCPCPALQLAEDWNSWAESRSCLSNVLIKMINAIGPCWAFLTRSTPTFFTYCVVFQHQK